MLSFLSCPVEEDSFVLLPVIVITQGRDEAASLAPSFLITCQWMMWGFGITIDF